MKMYKRLAKPISYCKIKRKRSNVAFIVIHYTGNKTDTAKNNADYFAEKNTRTAGAHFFVDSDGNIARSIPMNRSAWAVGGFYTRDDGSARFYKVCNNYNSVSIELCNAVSGYTPEQAKAVKKLIKYIRRYCPNAKKVIRHWDVNGKDCPKPMCGSNNKKWNKFLKDIGEEQ